MLHNERWGRGSALVGELLQRMGRSKDVMIRTLIEVLRKL